MSLPRGGYPSDDRQGLVPSPAAPPSPLRSLLLWGFAALAIVCGLLALGVWQVQRLAWKTDLIARVEARVHAAAVPAPAQDTWPAITRAKDEYRRVQLTGEFLYDRETTVYAVTDFGAGYWVMTPLRDDRGAVTLINRGFVPTERRAAESLAAAQAAGPLTVTGLIRMTEPHGAFLRANDPANDRWYSRDVEAIAAARDLGAVAPYFIDADAAANPDGYPRGGLTRITFPNSHLSYALTWFAMAAVAAGMYLCFARHIWLEYRRAQRSAPDA
ncbi:surfeit locus 1 family protein [Pseudochelatococcus lubricantis]|uniref:SURF1-like protein n=1 Tax=Pseudochelatococcus lubricantis TaxID=1538102 RepID=A0ABX0UXB0_9HYPH|nr:surfeit locus 1 family protein [Pseudochelatococcus lubricantis]